MFDPETIEETREGFLEFVQETEQSGDLYRPTHTVDATGAPTWTYPVTPVASNIPCAVLDLSGQAELQFREMAGIEKVQRMAEILMPVTVDAQEGDRFVTGLEQYEIRRVHNRDTFRLILHCWAVRYEATS